MYDIWYCPEYPVSEIKVSAKVDRGDREHWRPALLESIRERGLVNPLIVLNHRGPKLEKNWLMVGTNRHWAVTTLGWETAPVIITGECPYEPKVRVTWDTIQEYFPDGKVVQGYHGPTMEGNSLPHLGQMPA
jgi:hypothetical protein